MINKPLKEISVADCPVIGRGATGAVYKLDDERIVKLFNEGVDINVVTDEKKLAQNAFVAGVPTAISFENIKAGNRYGIIYELLNAKNLYAVMAEDRAHMYDYVKEYADFLRKCNAIEVDPEKFPSQKTRVLGGLRALETVGYTKSEVEKICSIIEKIPDKNTFIHGDAHIANVMLQNGELLLIDMMTAGSGHPIFELSSMYMLMNMVAKDPQAKTHNEMISEFTIEECRRIWEVFFSTYLESEDAGYLKKAEEQMMAFTSARMQATAVLFPGVIPPEALKMMKQISIAAYDRGVEDICF